MAKEKFLDRFKKAMGIITNNMYYQSDCKSMQEIQMKLPALREFKQLMESENRQVPDLKALEDDIAERESAQSLRANELKSREYHLTEKRQILLSKLSRSKFTSSVYKTTPDNQENTSTNREDDDISPEQVTPISQTPILDIKNSQEHLNNLHSAFRNVTHNLPIVRQGFVDRFKTAIGTLANNTTYQAKNDEVQQAQAEYNELQWFWIAVDDENRKIEELTKREEAIQLKDQALNAQESKIAHMEAEIVALESELSQQLEEEQHSADLYRKNNDMPQETPDFKIKAEALISTTLQDLQNALKEAEEEYRSAKITGYKVIPCEEKLQEIKGQILATLMVYSETLNNQELASCKIGDKNIPLQDLLSSAPYIFKMVEPFPFEPHPQHAERDVMEAYRKGQLREISTSDKVQLSVVTQYADLMENLVRLGVLEGNYYAYGVSGNLGLGGHSSTPRPGFAALLNKYCGVYTTFTKSRGFNTDVLSVDYRDPLKNYSMKKVPEPEQPTITEEAPEQSEETAQLTSPTVTEINKIISSDDDGR